MYIFLLLFAVIFEILNICDSYINCVEYILKIKENEECSNSQRDLISVFGVIASVTFIPFITLCFSIMISNKEKAEKIDKEFAEFKELSFFVISMPFGIWNSQVINYQATFDKFLWEHIPLLDFDYCLCLVFNNKCFPSYEFLLNGISYFDENKSAEILLRNRSNSLEYPYFISDTSGINNGKNQHGTTQLSVLLQTNTFNKSNEDNVILNENKNFIEYFMNDITKKKEISFNINIRNRGIKSFEKLRNALSGELKFRFPLFRTFFRHIIDKLQKTKQYDIKLKLESAPYSINEKKTKFKFNIVDIDISKTKGRYYKNQRKK